MSIADLQNAAKTQLAEWQELSSRVGNLERGMTELLQRQNAMLANARHLLIRIQAAAAILPGQLEAARQVLTELNELPEVLTAAATEAETLVADSVTRLTASAKEAEIVLGARTEQAIRETVDVVKAEFDELKGFVEDDFVDSLSENYEQHVEGVCEACETLRGSVEEHIDELIEEARKQVGDLAERIDGFGEQWKESVGEIKDAYDGLTSRIASLGRDVGALTNDIDLALDATGIGMNAATKSMDDIRAVMGGIV